MWTYNEYKLRGIVGEFRDWGGKLLSQTMAGYPMRVLFSILTSIKLLGRSTKEIRMKMSRSALLDQTFCIVTRNTSQHRRLSNLLPENKSRITSPPSPASPPMVLLLVRVGYKLRGSDTSMVSPVSNCLVKMHTL